MTDMQLQPLARPLRSAMRHVHALAS